jgi:hypothetical protein
VIERPRYSLAQRTLILKECASANDGDRVIGSLEFWWVLYQVGKHRDTTREVVDKWNRIVRRIRAVVDELNDDPTIELFVHSPAPLREMLIQAEEQLVRRRDDFASILANQRGNRDIHRQRLYSCVLYTWTHLARGTFVTSPASTTTGGPQSRFFLAAVEPILGRVLPADTLKSIFKRESKRRSGMLESLLPSELADAESFLPRGGELNQ